MSTAAQELCQLKQRLNRLGVNLGVDGLSSPCRRTALESIRPRADSQAGLQASAIDHHHSSQKEVAQLLQRLGSVELGLRAADNVATAAAARLHVPHQSLGGAPIAGPHSATALVTKSKSPSRPKKAGVRSKPVNGKAAVATANISPAVQALRASVAAALPRGASGVTADLLKAVPPHTPLSTVLHQYKEAEEVWAHEKASLRREALEQRKRANKAEAEVRRLTRLSEHRALDVKSLRSALKNRDTQLDAAVERIKELEGLISRTREEGVSKAASLAAERDDCKALLLATLQRLEAVDEVVHRADLSSSMMQDKMKVLEEERLRALEAAARARAEVVELTESRRKLQWQSKLLEKMSEVQLKHNKRKSDAIKKLLSTDPGLMNCHGVEASELEAALYAAGDDNGQHCSLVDYMQRAGL